MTARDTYVTRVEDVTPATSVTSKFEGHAYGSQASFYISRDEPGSGPGLHQHPYSETFIIEQGTVRFTVGEATLNVGPGDIVVVPPDTPHAFVNIGDGPMRSVNIHPVARMEQIDLD